MRKVIPYTVLALTIASVLVPVGIGYASKTIQPGLPIAEGRPLIPNSGMWCIAPCKYWYYNWMPNKARVSTTICNLSDRDSEFDLGDGHTIVIKSNSSVEHKYVVNLNEGIIRIPITKITAQNVGMNVVEQLNLKIVLK